MWLTSSGEDPALQIAKAGHCHPVAEGAICKTEACSTKSVSRVDYNIQEVLWRFLLVSTGCELRALKSCITCKAAFPAKQTE